jgi:N-acetylglucosaminyldiphosphoundecaprenol N-acetyl-beta-D-mannosaminyltransferase
MNATTTTSRAHPWIPLLDMRINRFSDPDIVQLVVDAVQNGGRHVIGNHNLNSMYLWYHEPRMREFYAIADYIHIDGMSLVLLGNLLGVPLRRRHRATSLDFFPLLAEQAVERGWRLFYLGSRPGVAAKAADSLRQQYPGLQIQTQHGHFDATRDSEESRSVLAEINAYAPHILFVGMGMPRQEIWIFENQQYLHANAIFPTGALMDYLAGEIPTAPRWLASLYLEWLYRLVSEPGRLWRRYLLEPWFVVGQVLRHCFKFKGRGMAAEVGRNE